MAVAGLAFGLAFCCGGGFSILFFTMAALAVSRGLATVLTSVLTSDLYLDVGARETDGLLIASFGAGAGAGKMGLCFFSGGAAEGTAGGKIGRFIKIPGDRRGNVIS